MVILRKTVAGLSRASLGHFVMRARRAVGLSGTVSVLVTSSSQVRRLNRRFRGKDKATDVLSFPARPLGAGESRGLAGDIAISADIAAHNAGRLGHSAAEEVKILLLHGMLHLAGFDHERDNGAMARKEAKLRQAFRLPVALIERNQPAQRNRKSRSARSGAARGTA